MTRIVFLALVLANVVLFLWSGWLEPSRHATHQMSPLPHVPPLKLISELTPAQKQVLVQSSTPEPTAAASAATPGQPAAQNVAVVCASYGPFPSTETAGAGISRLKKAGYQVTQRTLPGKVRLGYWVYLPPFGSHREADAAASLLKARGIKDLYVVNDQANRNAISLGVFTDRYGAMARQKKIREMGYHPLLTERFRDTAHYWLEAHGAGNRLPPASEFADLGEGDVKIERQACGSGT